MDRRGPLLNVVRAHGAAPPYRAPPYRTPQRLRPVGWMEHVSTKRPVPGYHSGDPWTPAYPPAVRVTTDFVNLKITSSKYTNALS